MHDVHNPDQKTCLPSINEYSPQTQGVKSANLSFYLMAQQSLLVILSELGKEKAGKPFYTKMWKAHCAFYKSTLCKSLFCLETGCRNLLYRLLEWPNDVQPCPISKFLLVATWSNEAPASTMYSYLCQLHSSIVGFRMYIDWLLYETLTSMSPQRNTKIL